MKHHLTFEDLEGALMSQVMVNLLKNATEALSATDPAHPSWDMRA